MTSDAPVIIDFEQLGGLVHSGRAKGELARSEFDLDAMDEAQIEILVRIPSSTYSVTTSFFLGLFGDSVRRAGSRDAFLRRYHFDSPEVFRATFDTCIARALREHTELIAKPQ